MISLFHWTGHLPDWSSPDDPARVLAAVGRLNPSVTKVCKTIIRVGYTKLKTLEYDKFRDDDGQLLLLDVRQHR